MKESHKDQAEQLRENVATDKEELPFNTSSLPSRKEVHSKKKQKIKWKMKYPLVKLMALFFILLPITVLAIYTSLSDDGESTKVDKETGSYSEVKSFEKYEENSQENVKDEEKKETETDKVKEEAATDKVKEEETDTTAEKEVITEEKETNTAVTKEEQATTEAVSTSVESETTTEESSQTKDGYKVIQHTVKANETVFRIAMNYYGSQEGIQIIKEYNGLSNNEIVVGQVLNIPIKE
ncbi:MAG: LysM peptidoglycan-binding domain-containing protein [Bacillus sp. (in: firmicutes)]